MKSELKLNGDMLILPALQVLRALPPAAGEALKEKGMRGPFGLYNVSIRSAFECLTKVLHASDDLSKISAPLTRKIELRILEEYLDALLDSVVEHAEACQSIVVSLQCVPGVSISVRSFNKHIAWYRDEVAKRVNWIKHHQGRIRHMHLSESSRGVLGYYVDGIHPDGTVGPALAVHPDGNSGISYNRDLRFHFAGLVAISSELASAARPICGSSTEGAFTPGANEFGAMAKRIAMLPSVVFPDEVHKPWPILQIESSVEAARLVVQYPGSDCRPRGLGPTMRGSVTFGPDGEAKSFKIPYVGPGIASKRER